MRFFKWTMFLLILSLGGIFSFGEMNLENSFPGGATRQLILIGVDGMQVARFERLLTDHRLPNFSRLIGRGGSDSTATITKHKIPFTAPGNAELLSGLGSSDTGIVDDTCNLAISSGKTIFERLNSFDPSIHLGSIYGKGTCTIPDALLKNARHVIEWWQTRSSYPQRIYVNEQCADAKDVATKSLEFISDKRTKSFFLLIFFGDPDCAGHQFGEPSLEYDRALTNVDSGMGILLDGLSKNEISPRILLTGDHGWNEGSRQHNKPDINTLTIPFLANDSALFGSILPEGRKKPCDIAPTILAFFGLESTRYADISEGGCSSFMSPE